MSVRKRLKRLENSVKDLKGDQDYHTADIGDMATGVTLSTNWQFAYLSGIAQGDTHSNRDGDKVTFKSLLLRIILDTGDKDDIVRIVVFRYIDTDGAAPTGTGNNGIFEDNYVTSPLAIHNTDNFKVYFDKVVTLDGSDHSMRYVKFFTKLNHVGRYSGTGSTEASQQMGAWYLAFIAHSAATTAHKIKYKSRMRFIP